MVSFEEIKTQYPVSEKTLATFSVSKRWILLQSVGYTLMLAAWIAITVLMDRYVPPDPAKYEHGILHYLLVRGISLIVPMFLTAVFPPKLYHTSCLLHMYLWAVYVFGPLVVTKVPPADTVYLPSAYYLLYFPGYILALLLLWARMQAVKYIVTDKRLIIMDTWLSREAKTKIYSKLSNVVLKQSFMGRILGYGSVIPVVADLESFGVSPLHFRVPFIVNPEPTNSLFQVPCPEEAWKILQHLVQYRDVGETVERVGERIVEKLERIEKKSPAVLYV